MEVLSFGKCLRDLPFADSDVFIVKEYANVPKRILFYIRC